MTCTLARASLLSRLATLSIGLNCRILGLCRASGYQEINTPKLDWQINEKEHVSLLYHRLRWDSPGGVQTQATNNYGVDTWGNDFVKLDYGVAKLTSILTRNISNELLYQYGRELNDESQQPFSAYTKANLVGTGGNVPEVALDTSGSPTSDRRTTLTARRCRMSASGRSATCCTARTATTASSSAWTWCTTPT